MSTDRTPGTHCLECEIEITPDKGIETSEGVFCRECYENLLAQVKEIVQGNGRDIDYFSGVGGAIAGGALGVLAWWGFTYVTQYAFGLVAIVIGVTVAKGMLLATKGKRSPGLQAIAVGVTVMSYFYADYLVTRSFVLKENPMLSGKLSLIPSPDVFIDISRLNMTAMSVVFLGIAVWQAWSMTRPVRFRQE